MNLSNAFVPDYWSDTEARVKEFLIGKGADIPKEYHPFCIRMMEEALRHNNIFPTDEYQFEWGWGYSPTDSFLDAVGSICLCISVGDVTHCYRYTFN